MQKGPLIRKRPFGFPDFSLESRYRVIDQIATFTPTA